MPDPHNDGGLELAPCDALEPEALHRAFTAAFADYVAGPFEMPLARWPALLARQGVDLARSRAALAGGSVAAFAFAAPRPAIARWRLATMGAVPEARRAGAARALLDDFVSRAAAEGCATELECFAQNERALALYTARGFRAVSPLYGYERAVAPGDAPPPAGAPIEPDDAFRWLDAVLARRDDLPLQVTSPSLRALVGALHARRLGSAQVVYTADAHGTLTVQSLVDTDPVQLDAERLVASLHALAPTGRIVVPQLQRPDVGGEALERLGFARAPLHQLFMRR